MSVGRVGPFLQSRAVLRRARRLPVPGRVLLDVGDRVTVDTVVARAVGQGAMHTVNAARLLDILPSELPGAMRCAVGDEISVGQVLARTRGLFGVFAMECRAPVSGTVAAVSTHTGRVLLEESGVPLEVKAFLPGIVTEVEADRGVMVAGWAAWVAGVYGVGGERVGQLVAGVGRPEATLEASMLDDAHAGSVVLGGALVTEEALERAACLGVQGIITGGVHDGALMAWLGQETPLADTTGLAAPLTVVVVGGLGRVPLEKRTDALLREHLGRAVCVSGWSRVRAGTVRPEVFVPLDHAADASATEQRPAPLAIGSAVQIVRSPWFGCCGRVGRLPFDPVRVESGALCVVAEVDLVEGGVAVVPLANLEVLTGPDEEVDA